MIRELSVVGFYSFVPAGAYAAEQDGGLHPGIVMAAEFAAKNGRQVGFIVGTAVGAEDRSLRTGEPITTSFAKQTGENLVGNFASLGAGRAAAVVAGPVAGFAVGVVANRYSREIYDDYLIEPSGQPDTVGGLQAKLSGRSSITGVVNGIQQYNLFPAEGEITSSVPDIYRTIDAAAQSAARATLGRDGTAVRDSRRDENLGPVNSNRQFWNGLANAAVLGLAQGILNGAASGGGSSGGSPCRNGHTQACWDWINKTARGLPDRGPTLGRVVPSR